MTEQEIVVAWLQSKGVSVWPALPWGDTADRNEVEQLAGWWLEQQEDYQSFKTKLIEQVKVDPNQLQLQTG